MLLPESFAATRPPVADWGKPARIIPAGGSMISYRADEILDLILREFINVELNAAGALSFVNRFGPLTEAGNDENKGESVARVLTIKNAMTEVIDRLAEIDIGERADAIEELLGADGIRMLSKNELEVRIVFDRRSKTPKAQLKAKDLITALWLRMIELFTGETALRRCAHCSALFTAGVGTGRRLDALFCSDAHRYAYHRLKNASDEKSRERRRPSLARRATV